MNNSLKQVIHKRCKGQIVTVADEHGVMQLCCRKCKLLWNLASDIPFWARIIMADDMRRIKDKEAQHDDV